VNLDELYDALSGRITAAVVNHQTIEWADYFSQMREVIRSVAQKALTVVYRRPTTRNS
jgi:hypothetical protein